MGFRTLVEINHDNLGNIEDRPDLFVSHLLRYAATGDKQFINMLAMFDVTVVATRHSADKYHIPASKWGFPARLPWEDFEDHRDMALIKAREITGGKVRSRADLIKVIASLMEIIDWQQEALDASQ